MATKITSLETNCPICFEVWNKNDNFCPWVFPCGHMICEKCYLKIKTTSRKCHMCREKFNIRQNRKNKKCAERKKRLAIIYEEITDDLEIYYYL